MNTDLECRQTDISDFSIATQLELTDLDADRCLLDLPGTSLVVFTSTGCASCRWARQALGGKGLLLGWAPPVQAAIRRQAARGLAQFRGTR